MRLLEPVPHTALPPSLEEIDRIFDRYWAAVLEVEKAALALEVTLAESGR